MAGIGLGRMFEGAAEGVDRGLARREYGKESERRDIQFEQGQQDRDYSLTRRTIEDARADEQYKLAADKQKRFGAGNEALRDWMTTGSVDSINNFMNEYTAEGVDHALTKNEDGTYTGRIDYEGEQGQEAEVSEEDIGTYLQVLMTDDSYAKLVEQGKTKQAAKAKQADRAHDMAKLEKEYELRRGLEVTKAGTKAATEKGKGKVPDYEKEIENAAGKLYGGTFDGINWSFDSATKEAKYGIHRDLSRAFYLSGSESVSVSDRETQRAMAEIEASARGAVDAELDNGTIDKKQYEARLSEVMNEYADLVIKKMSPAPGEALARVDTEIPKTDTNTDIDPEAIKQLKADPSAEMKKYFDDIFGAGSADQVLGGGGGSVEGGGAGGAPMLSRKEKPQEQEKNQPLTRQQGRVQGRESRKAHSKLAVSEYKNEWVNMDDKEKLDWWQENSSALKAASPRSHKKANQEIKEIRKQSARGRNK